MTGKTEFGLSFLDVLSCTLGGLIVIFAIFSAMDHTGADKGVPTVGVLPSLEDPPGKGTDDVSRVFRFEIKGPRPHYPTEAQLRKLDNGVTLLLTDACHGEQARAEEITWYLTVVSPEPTENELTIPINLPVGSVVVRVEELQSGELDHESTKDQKEMRVRYPPGSKRKITFKLNGEE